MSNKQRLIYSREDVKEILHAGNSYIHYLFTKAENPIPHFRIGRRIVVPCDLFDQWLIKGSAFVIEDEKR